MKKFKLLMLLAIVAATLSANAQGFVAKYGTFGGKKEQKELKKVFIGDFVVRQILQRYATAKAGGGLTNDPVYAHMTVDFGNVNKDAYQAVVTDAYNYTVQKFKSLGYEVITGDDAKTKTDKELKTYEVTGAQNMDRLGKHSAIYPKDKLLYDNNSLFGNNAWMKLAKDLDAIVFKFAFQVEYVSYKQESGGTFVNKAELSAHPYLAISQTALCYVSKGAGSLLMNPQKAPDDWVGPEGFKKTSSGSVGASWFTSDKISTSSKYSVDINQEKYLGYVKDYLQKEIDATIDTFIKEAVQN
ncbi:MAG TPA: hypothetical protein VL490_02235 [Mucilaginibacter sp.]|jgi:hypothetical protein|nr:hypothetical protein [Mucilaginibacter sp.]